MPSRSELVYYTVTGSSTNVDYDTGAVSLLEKKFREGTERRDGAERNRRARAGKKRKTKHFFMTGEHRLQKKGKKIYDS